MSPTMKDVKIKMMQYARNMVTGRVPTGEAVPVVPAYAEDKEADDDAFDYELAAAVRLKEVNDQQCILSDGAQQML